MALRLSARAKGILGIALFTVLLYWALRAYERLREAHPEAAGGFRILEAMSVAVYVLGVSLLAYYMIRRG